MQDLTEQLQEVEDRFYLRDREDLMESQSDGSRWQRGDCLYCHDVFCVTTQYSPKENGIVQVCSSCGHEEEVDIPL